MCFNNKTVFYCLCKDSQKPFVYTTLNMIRIVLASTVTTEVVGTCLGLFFGRVTFQFCYVRRVAVDRVLLIAVSAQNEIS